jgi:hypothetical protein
MALVIGDISASSGMTKEIYDQLETLLSPPLQGMSTQDLEKVKTGWKQLAFAIATGVVNHIKSNMEIFGIQTAGGVNVKVSGDTGTTGGHSHTLTNVPGSENNAVFTQSNDGTGHVG